MAFKEVMNMRKTDVNKAYEMALSDYQEINNDWTKRALSWCIFDKLKNSALYAQKDIFISNLKKLKEIELSASDNMIWRNIAWPISAFVRDCSKADYLQEDIFSIIMEIIKDFPFVKPSKEYSILLNAFMSLLKRSNNWHNIICFCDWWNFENLREEDFKREVYKGRTMPTSLAENAHLAYAKSLLTQRDRSAIADFLPKLQELAEKYPDMIFPNYYIGKLMLAIGSNGEDALSVILPFVRKKKTEYWAWQLLSELFINDTDKYISCLLRAVNCRTKEDFLVNIYLMLAETFRNISYYNDAHYYLDKYLQVKRNTATKVSAEASAMLNESWYNESSNQNLMFTIDYISITDDILFHDIDETYAVVSFVNTDKKIANVIYAQNKMGHFKYDRFLNNIRIGDPLNIRIDSINPEGRMNLYSAKKADCIVDTDFCKTLIGTVSSNPAKTAFFLNAENESCYIPNNFIEKKSINVGDTITVLALYTYNKNKDTWNWSCVKVK